jgi:hypothetical protein
LKTVITAREQIIDINGHAPTGSDEQIRESIKDASSWDTYGNNNFDIPAKPRPRSALLWFIIAGRSSHVDISPYFNDKPQWDADLALAETQYNYLGAEQIYIHVTSITKAKSNGGDPREWTTEYVYPSTATLPDWIHMDWGTWEADGKAYYELATAGQPSTEKRNYFNSTFEEILQGIAGTLPPTRLYMVTQYYLSESGSSQHYPYFDFYYFMNNAYIKDSGSEIADINRERCVLWELHLHDEANWHRWLIALENLLKIERWVQQEVEP